MRELPVSSMQLGQVLRVLASTLMVLLVISYVLFQARNLIQGPRIELQGELPTVQHERMVTLRGTAKNIVSLTLNGNTIFTDEHGNFSKVLVLPNGYTIMTLMAKDRFGRTTSLTRSFVLVPHAS